MIKDYTIEIAFGKTEFVNKCQNRINKGWTPIGPAQISAFDASQNTGDIEMFYCQTFHLIEETE